MYISFFTADVDEQLMMVANINSCPERERYIILLMDEMHIKSDLAYDKHTSNKTVPMCIHVILGCAKYI